MKHLTFKTSFFYQLFIILIVVVGVNNAFSQSSIEFIENKGQFHDNVLYKSFIPGGALFLEKSGFTYNFIDEHDIKHSHAHHGYHGEEEDDGVLNFHAYKVNFVNANQSVNINPIDKTLDYNNYFLGNDRDKWAQNVSKYLGVNYKNLYDGVEMKIYFKGGVGLKYDFIIQPGQDPNVIKMSYNGVDALELKEGSLVIKTSVNEVIESHPVAYQKDGKHLVEIPCEYVLVNNTVSFHFPNGFDNDKEIIIDPELVFCTYSGSTVDNWGFTATYDLYGNVFSGGIVMGIGYPVSTGAWQEAFGGGNWDVGIIKYTPDGGQRIYATYLGGSGCEMPHSLVVNASNELLLFGTTGSADFPMGLNAYDYTFGGGEALSYDNLVTFDDGIDIYVTKLSAAGNQLLGSTYVGGSGNDGLNFKAYIDDDTSGDLLMHGNDSLYYNYADGARGEIITDGKNNVYVGTTTFSNNLQDTYLGFQGNPGGGQDGLVFKLDANLSNMLWCSYLGGSGDDAVYSLDTDSDYNVYVCGGTNSDNFPVTSGAYISTRPGGTADGFIAQINDDGNNLMHSTFFGSSNYDQTYFVRLDKYDIVYAIGQTEALGTDLVYNASYSVSGGGQFATKIKPTLDDVIWTTRFGSGSGKPDISLTAFTVDICNRVYLSGWGREWAYYSGYTWTTINGTNNLEVTDDAEYYTTDGQDFYIMVLADDASGIDYATYFGEQQYDACSFSGHDHVDGGTSRFDKKGNIYQSVCASCGGCNAFPTTTGVWSEDNGASPYNNCNNAVFSFSFLKDFCVADFIQPEIECAPAVHQFENTSGNASEYYWDFGDNTTSTEENPSHTYTESGVYQVMLVAVNDTSCNYADTIIKEVTILNNSVDTLQDVIICPGENPQIGIQPNMDPSVTYTWFPADSVSDATISNPLSEVNTDQTLMLIVESSPTCRDTLYQEVSFKPDEVSISVSPDTIVCEGGTVDLLAVSPDEVDSYWWSDHPAFNTMLNPGQTDTGALTITINEAGYLYARVNGIYCNAFDTASVYVDIYEVGIEAGNNQTICRGDSANLLVEGTVAGDTYSYSWTGSDILTDPNQPDIQVNPIVQQQYTVVGINQHGCETTDNIILDVDSVVVVLDQIGDITCHGDCDGSIAVATQFGALPFVYNWDNGSTTSQLENICGGTYLLTITDQYGCSDELEVQLQEPDELIALVADTINTQCDGGCSGQIQTSVTGGSPSYDYIWSNGVQSPNAVGLCVGEYEVTVTDSHGCTAITGAIIQDPSDLSLVLTEVGDILCYGDCDGQLVAQPGQGVPPYQYSWSNGSDLQLIDGLCAGTYEITVMDAQMCLRIMQTTLEQPVGINGQMFGGSIACYGDSTYMGITAGGGTGTLTYNWEDEFGFLSNGNQLNNISVGTYYLTITDENNCTQTYSRSITQPDLLLYDSLVDPLTCYDACDGEIHLNMTGGVAPYSFDWSNGMDDSVLTDLCAGTYQVTMMDAYECLIIKEFDVPISDYELTVNITADDTVLYPGNSTMLHSSDQFNIYNWTPANTISFPTQPNVIVNPDQTTTYELNVLDSHGCPAKDTITIYIAEVFCREPYIYIPNAFSPNNDGLNDELYVYSNMITDLYFVVFDRWGEIMFETDDINDGWDGTFRGKDVDPAVFVYYLKATCHDMQQFSKQGNVTLIR
jgi:gliding motility-associated-like protein